MVQRQRAKCFFSPHFCAVSSCNLSQISHKKKRRFQLLVSSGFFFPLVWTRPVVKKRRTLNLAPYSCHSAEHSAKNLSARIVGETGGSRGFLSLFSWQDFILRGGIQLGIIALRWIKAINLDEFLEDSAVLQKLLMLLMV